MVRISSGLGLWAWTLGIPAGTKQAGDAKKFLEWVTSKSYNELLAAKNGWGAVPTGTRQSTYDNLRFQADAVFAEAELKAIWSADPTSSTFNPSLYNGVQFAAIPEFKPLEQL